MTVGRGHKPAGATRELLQAIHDHLDLPYVADWDEEPKRDEEMRDRVDRLVGIWRRCWTEARSRTPPTPCGDGWASRCRTSRRLLPRRRSGTLGWRAWCGRCEGPDPVRGRQPLWNQKIVFTCANRPWLHIYGSDSCSCETIRTYSAPKKAAQRHSAASDLVTGILRAPL